MGKIYSSDLGSSMESPPASSPANGRMERKGRSSREEGFSTKGKLKKSSLWIGKTRGTRGTRLSYLTPKGQRVGQEKIAKQETVRQHQRGRSKGSTAGLWGKPAFSLIYFLHMMPHHTESAYIEVGEIGEQFSTLPVPPVHLRRVESQGEKNTRAITREGSGCWDRRNC
jgi:hypothetical protein